MSLLKEIEQLSNEQFNRDDMIAGLNEDWCRKKAKKHKFEFTCGCKDEYHELIRIGSTDEKIDAIAVLHPDASQTIEIIELL